MIAAGNGIGNLTGGSRRNDYHVGGVGTGVEGSRDPVNVVLRDKRRSNEGEIRARARAMGRDSCEQRATSDAIGEKDREGTPPLQGKGGKMEHVFVLWESSHGDHFLSSNLIICP